MSAEDNQRWVRDAVAKRGWTSEIESEAKRRMSTVPSSPEGPAHPNELCACCNGSATTLKVDLATTTYTNTVYICADREVCRSTMIFENMIAQTRSA